MRESLDLHQQQQTVQRLSPRQVQFVRILEMTTPEVEEEVRRQLEDNPALEVSDTDASADVDTDAHDADGEVAVDTPMADPDDDPADGVAYGSYSSSSASARADSWQIANDSPTLADLLDAQIGQTDLPESIANYARYIVGNLDDNGYMTRPLMAMADDITNLTGKEVDMAEIRQAFNAVRELDPAGISAVDLRDCLLLQLKRMKPSSLTLKIATEIVADYFDLLSKKHYDRLSALLGIDDKELKDALALIRTLNPKPGAALNANSMAQKMAQITPDVAVEINDEGNASVWLPFQPPALQIERTFNINSDAKPKTRQEKQAQAFIKLKYDEADAFISAIKQRGRTLLAVTEAIAKRQKTFFLTGDTSQIRPMLLRDIAADTGLDLSVISRATAGKYVATPLGTYPLKLFFNESSGGEADTSTHQILHVMKQVIDAEDHKHPLSDRAIQEAMEEKGYSLARRTITKYREKLGIPVGRLRKKI